MNMNEKFLQGYIKQIHSKSISLLYFLSLRMIVDNFYIENAKFLISIESLLFVAVVLILQSMKESHEVRKYIFELIKTKTDEAIEKLNCIESALKKKIFFINSGLVLIQMSFIFVLIDVIIKNI